MAIDIDMLKRSLEEAGIDENGPDGARLIELLSAGENGIESSCFIPENLDIGMIARKRSEGIPLEYALGIAEFMGRIFCCNPDTLIPREDTSLLVNTAVSAAGRMIEAGIEQPRVIEIGTGCGNIAIMAALLSENVQVYASDISGEAVRVARRNVEAYGLSERITLRSGDMFEPLGEFRPVDMVICNPPYIPSGSLDNLGREIIDHEPVLALDAGTYGIDIFRRLIKASPDFLRDGGVLTFEFGERQEKIVERLLNKHGGYGGITLHEYDGVPRVASAFKTDA